MLDILDRAALTEESKPSATEKRAAIETELRGNPHRSDREIAGLIGCDHKTVGAARSRLGIATHVGNSPAGENTLQPHGGESGGDGERPTLAQFRNMMINGAKDFEAKYPPETAEQVVDRVLAEKLVAPAATVESADFDWMADDAVILKRQLATAIYFNKAGDLVIRQEADWNEDGDAFVYIAEPFQQAFLDKICDVMGIPSMGK